LKFPLERVPITYVIVHTGTGKSGRRVERRRTTSADFSSRCAATSGGAPVGSGYGPRVIVWVSSFPRSGNTYLRIVLKQLYGLQTAVVYDVDGVAERLGADFVGFVERAGPIEALRESEQVHFVKTHRQRDDQVDASDRAICLVRDGRDALLSWAHLRSEADPSRFYGELRMLINRRDRVGTGSWGTNVLSWLRPSLAHRVMLRYHDLVGQPRSTVARVMADVR
jgi:Sulfotransferase domain